MKPNHRISLILIISSLFEYGNCYRDEPKLRINKCCEEYQVYVANYCTHVQATNVSIWQPQVKSSYVFVTGLPDCGSTQRWPIFSNNSTDRLRLLPDGTLRHAVFHHVPVQYDDYDLLDNQNEDVMHYDYPQGKYCMDKRIDGNRITEYALVCFKEQLTEWTTTEFVMRNIVNPVTHAISIVCLLFVAIIYFIMPTLKDLVGNIITTICMCLIVSQSADLARLLTVFTSHISIIITETFCYVSLLGAFFWLNSMAYYIWKTFRSRNVFLRITDGGKYCYYSAYSWSCTFVMGLLAIFAHYTLDYTSNTTVRSVENGQESIGSLGIIIFFMPIAFTVLANVFFLATTLKIINRMNTYGRIHHKLKHSFRMFVLLFVTLAITWIFFLMSFSKYDGLIYCHIIINAMQGPMILYICVCNQKHVSYVIRKTCCYIDCFCCNDQREPEADWGDEMSAMNTSPY